MTRPSAPGVTYAIVGSFVMPIPLETEGLHVFRVEIETGALTPVSTHAPGLNVGSFAMDNRRGVLYVTDEIASSTEFREKHGVPGGGGGRIFAFNIDHATGGLTELGHWPSYGTQPAGIALDRSGDYLVVSHFTSRTTTTAVIKDAQSGYRIEPRYDDATTVMFPLDASGRLESPCDIHIHASTGTSTPSCLHSISLSRDGSFLIECDMSKDKLLTFAVDPAPRSLHLRGVFEATPGSGPRYSAFHPVLPVFYVNYEYRPVIETFVYREGGSFKSLGTADVLPDNLDTGRGVLLSDLRVHPSGNFVYTLVRGHNVISVFSVDRNTGLLQRTQTAALDGVSPKGCAVSPGGRFLYVTASVSNKVQVWSIGNRGLLTSTGQTVAVPRPGPIALIQIPPS